MRKDRPVVLCVIAFIAAGVLAVTAAGSGALSSVALGSTSLGKVLVAANGRTLYMFTADKGKTSTCYGTCAAYWPPLLAGKPSVGAGLNASIIGTTKRRDGQLQVTYGGHPLYSFVKDTKAGDVKGQGIVHFGGSWWVVSASGQEITAKT